MRAETTSMEDSMAKAQRTERPRDPDLERKIRAAQDENPAKIDKPVQPTPEQLRDTQFVKHLPHQFFGARVITEAQWAQIGVRQRTTEWNEGNGFMLPKSMFSEEALRYLIHQDDGFRIVDR